MKIKKYKLKKEINKIVSAMKNDRESILSTIVDLSDERASILKNMWETIYGQFPELRGKELSIDHTTGIVTITQEVLKDE